MFIDFFEKKFFFGGLWVITHKGGGYGYLPIRWTIIFFFTFSIQDLGGDFFANFKKNPMKQIYQTTNGAMGDLGVASYMVPLGSQKKVIKKLTLQ